MFFQSKLEKKFFFLLKGRQRMSRTEKETLSEIKMSIFSLSSLIERVQMLTSNGLNT